MKTSEEKVLCQKLKMYGTGVRSALKIDLKGFKKNSFDQLSFVIFLAFLKTFDSNQAF
jgi:hypothetical protein